MFFSPAPLDGVFVIEMQKFEDERGYFARSWCSKEFAEHHLEANLVQCSVSFNRTAGTLRGMHFQIPPHGETKLVRCTRGALFDVALDLRPHSPTFLKWFGVELTVDNGKMLYIPKGFAHGFQTLADETDVLYQMADFYIPDAARGVRWNDPLFGIKWPRTTTVISQRDREYPDSAPEHFTMMVDS
jgi:dTDP-4-dehydrorhamnose 3,5-epimerase